MKIIEAEWTVHRHGSLKLSKSYQTHDYGVSKTLKLKASIDDDESATTVIEALHRKARKIVNDATDEELRELQDKYREATS